MAKQQTNKVSNAGLTREYKATSQLEAEAASLNWVAALVMVVVVLIGFVYMLHFASYTPDIGQYQEYKRGIDRIKHLFDPPLHIKDGALSVPSGPGVGIVDMDDVLKDTIPA